MISEMQSKTTMIYHVISIRLVKTKNFLNVDKNMKEWRYLYTLGSNIFTKLKMHTS